MYSSILYNKEFDLFLFTQILSFAGGLVFFSILDWNALVIVQKNQIHDAPQRWLSSTEKHFSIHIHLSVSLKGSL